MVRVTASRHAAAWVSAGGRTTSDAPIARLAAHRSPIAAQRPAGPVAASRCPGSGLSASVWYLVRPSGKSTVFWKSAAGAVTEAGAVAATSAVVVMPAVTANLVAARAPSLAASIAAMTGRAGQAVALMAHAAPRAMAAASRTRRGRRHPTVQASVRLSSASTGRSVSPVVSGRASTGEPKANAVLRSALPGLASRNAATRAAAAVMPIQSLGLPPAPGRPAAAGRPKIAIAGSYGLYSRTCVI
jgi:hypothetical protein